MGTKILISAQNEEEVDQILKVPPDIVDLKNPMEGSLGAPPITLIAIIRKKLDAFNLAFHKTVKLSVAIGDFPNLPGTASMAAYGTASFNPDYVKIGLFGPRTQEEGIRLTQAVVDSVHQVNPHIKIVTVGYADYKRINASVDPMLIPVIAHQGGADVAMLDTAIKNGISTFVHLSLDQIHEFVTKCKDLGLSAALAGSLHFEDLDSFNKITADILGVRSMVCENFDRVGGKIQPTLIARLKSKVH